MILSDDLHDYDCSACSQTGLPCMEGLWLLQRLARSLRVGSYRTLPAGFEMSAATEFHGCARTCNVLFRLTAERLELLCGLPDTLDEPAARPARARIVTALDQAALDQAARGPAARSSAPRQSATAARA